MKKKKNKSKLTNRLTAVLILVALCLAVLGTAVAVSAEDAADEPQASVSSFASEPEANPGPACICKVRCSDNARNENCPACKETLSGCSGTVPKYTLSILSPSGWSTTRADAIIRVTDESATGFTRLEAKIDSNGSWQDLTDSVTGADGAYNALFELTDNCTVYVSLTGADGKVVTKSRYIECFDREAPTIRAGIDGELLRVEAEDGLSGVGCVYICGQRYTNLVNGTLDVPLKKCADGYEDLNISAVDMAGNKSKILQIENPCYQAPQREESGVSSVPEAKPEPEKTPTLEITHPTTGTAQAEPEKPSAVTKPAAPASAGKKPASATADPDAKKDTKPNPLTPDGTGTVTDNATGEDEKEFYTITTADEDTFYLVIDKQRGNQNVYFLNTVTDQDLTALAEKKKNPDNVSAVPEPEPVCICEKKCAPGEVDTLCPVCKNDLTACIGEEPVTPEPEPEVKKPESGNSTGMIVFIIIAVLAVGGAGYYFKIYRPKHDFEDEDGEDWDEDEEPAVNEDETEAPAPDAEPEEPDYNYPIEDYPDEEPEERS